MTNNYPEVGRRVRKRSSTSEQLHKEIREKEKQIAKLQAQLVQTGKMAALGLRGAGIAHELNNPLTVISAEADEILDAIESGNYDTRQTYVSVKNIKGFADRMRVIVDHIRQYVREDTDSNWTKIDLNQVITDSLIILRRQLTNSDITVKLSLSEDLPQIWGQHNKLESVFQNLIANAKDAFQSIHDDRSRKISIISEMQNSKIVVKVRDNACGMSQDVLQKIYSPFFTTKSREDGTGIGMSMVQNIVKEHHGEIMVNSVVGKGTVFTLKFPLERRNCDNP